MRCWEEVPKNRRHKLKGKGKGHQNHKNHSQEEKQAFDGVYMCVYVCLWIDCKREGETQEEGENVYENQGQPGNRSSQELLFRGDSISKKESESCALSWVLVWVVRQASSCPSSLDSGAKHRRVSDCSVLSSSSASCDTAFVILKTVFFFESRPQSRPCCASPRVWFSSEDNSPFKTESAVKVRVYEKNISTICPRSSSWSSTHILNLLQPWLNRRQRPSFIYKQHYPTSSSRQSWQINLSKDGSLHCQANDWQPTLGRQR